VVCSKLCGVPEQNSGGLIARNPERLIKWFIAVVVIAVGVNLLSSSVVTHKWAWLPPAVFVAALLVAVPSAGLLRRERYRTTRAREIITEGATQSPIPRTGVPFLLFGVATLAGIGFMVSLLIGEFAYGVADSRAVYVRIGVLASSLLAAALAAVIFRSWNRAYRDLAAIEERDSGADGIPDVYDATTHATTGSGPPTAHSAAGTPRGWG
jgi:hypothetical protein